MSTSPSERQAHWEKVYRTKPVDSVSWYRPHLQASLELLDRAGMSVDSRVIDVGAGASTLVDDLIERGIRSITALDVSPEALRIVQQRLDARGRGEAGRSVTWLAGDVMEVDFASGSFDIWHDRAVLHFLTDPADAARYARKAADAVRAGGHAVIGGFAPDGPERCSGLPVTRRSADDIAALLAPAFTLVEGRTERHVTPGGAEQSFAYALLERQV